MTEENNAPAGNPRLLTVRIEVEPILTTSTFIRVPEPRGLRSGFEATVEPAQVRVVCPLADVEVRVDGRAVGLTPLLAALELSPGAHEL